MITTLLPAAAGAYLDAVGLDVAYGADAAAVVRANFAVTVDGAVEVDGRSGGIGGPSDRAVFAHLRSMADVVLVGSGTVRAERYGAVRLDDPAKQRRRARGQAEAIPVAVLTNRAALPSDHRLFVETAAPGEARPLVLTCAAAPPEARAALDAVAEVVVCGDDDIDDAAALAALTERGLTRVLCEGGPTVVTRLLRAGLVDELCLTFAPLLAGPGHAGLGAGAAFERAARLELIGLLSGGDGTLLARYGVDSASGAQ